MRKPLRWLLPALCALCLLCPPALAEVDPPRSPYTLKDAHIYHNGPEDAPRIAITMDDCYDIRWVEATLDLCDQYGVRMTFFPVGAAIDPAEGDVWRRMVAAGHDIGNHTYGHKTFPHKSRAVIHQQMVRMEECLDAALGEHYQVVLARPPYGRTRPLTSNIQTILAQEGYPWLILWDVDTTDPDKALAATQNGSILLFHSNEKDVACLAELLPRLLEAGYEPVPVTELLGLPVPPKAGYSVE